MILPIVAYGHPVLRKVAHDIDAGFPELEKLIADMWETMYASNGVGLAAPQINKNIIFNCSLCFSSPFDSRTLRCAPLTKLLSPHTWPDVKKRLAYNSAV